jgi:hypothetical protein
MSRGAKKGISPGISPISERRFSSASYGILIVSHHL